MRRTQQGAVVAISVIGILVLAVGAVVLVNELRNERQARERLEQESADLRAEIEKLKTPYRGGIIITETSGSGFGIQPDEEDFIELFNDADVAEEVDKAR